MDTFIVRIWSPGGSPVDPAPLRGVVERAGSGEAVTFVGANQLIELLRSSEASSRIERETEAASETLS